MASVDFSVPRISSLMMPQNSGVTCWAACAAGLKSVKKGKLLMETDVLPADYLPAFNQQTTLLLGQITDCYQKMGFTKIAVDVSSRTTFADFVKSKAPLIVGSEIVTKNAGGQLSHVGYHVRLVYGVWGQTESANEDEFQVRIFDPSPQPGFTHMQGFLWSHFKFQMKYNIGTVQGLVGTGWYL